MKKIEAIQKAYGEYWEDNKDLIDDDGWCMMCNKTHIDIKNHLIENPKMYDPKSKMGSDFVQTLFRPKTLQGIETNNGWIKSDDNLSKTHGDYFLYYKDGIVLGYYDPFLECFCNMEAYMLPEPSHYQPIHKPKLPIY